MRRRTAYVCLLLALVVGASLAAKTTVWQASPDPMLKDHVTWVIQSLRRMESIKPGMTRADLLKLFKTEGGIQTGRTFVYRDCPYFKVTVEFEPTAHVLTGTTPAEPMAHIDGLPGDVIKAISRPFIQGMIID